MDQRTTIQLKNELTEIQRVADLITEFGERHCLSVKVLFAVNLALDEILTNVISYGYQDRGEHTIAVHLMLKEGALIVEVEDDGRPFNPLEAPEPDIHKPLEERPIGGLGIHLVRNLMDELEYTKQATGNRLVMKKRLTEA